VRPAGRTLQHWSQGQREGAAIQGSSSKGREGWLDSRQISQMNKMILANRMSVRSKRKKAINDSKVTTLI
jgi:hypothetical protein